MSVFCKKKKAKIRTTSRSRYRSIDMTAIEEELGTLTTKIHLPPVRIELTTPGLRDQCSTTELKRHRHRLLFDEATEAISVREARQVLRQRRVSSSCNVRLLISARSMLYRPDD